jgi:hypothetical protein
MPTFLMGCSCTRVERVARRGLDIRPRRRLLQGRGNPVENLSPGVVTPAVPVRSCSCRGTDTFTYPHRENPLIATEFLMFQLLRSFRAMSASRRSQEKRRRSARPIVEALEDRLVPTVQLQLMSAGAISSYAGVGFQESDVGYVLAQVNGQPDTNKADYQAQINWGNGTSKGDLVYEGVNGNWAEFLIKGSNTYSRAATNTPISVTVTCKGTPITGQTCSANVSDMPSGIAGAQPNPTANSSAPEDVQLQIMSAGAINSYVGVGFQENDLGYILAQVNGQADTILSHFHAQVNWGDSSSWNKADLVYEGVNGNWAEYLIKGSHTYDTAGTNIPIVLFAQGPDGTSISAQTCSANPTDMPSGFPGTLPAPNTNSSLPEDVQFQLMSAGSISANVGIPLKQVPIGYFLVQVQGQPDANPLHFQAQINWGDSSSWDKGSLAYQGVNGNWAQYEIFGSHTYEQTSNNDPIVVFVNGPDATSTSGQTSSASVGPNPYGMSLGNLSASQWDDNQPGYDGTIPISGGTGGYNNVNVTDLPKGLTGSVSQNEVVIKGTPTQSGPFTLGVTVDDSTGGSDTNYYSLTINAPVALGPLSPTQWNQGQPGYDGTIQITGGTGLYSNATVAGLPAGLSYSLQGGTISITGTPSQGGVFTLDVSAQDSDGEQGTGTYSLTINSVNNLTLGNLSPTQWTLNQAGYHGTIQVSGGSGSYGNAVITGLPTGLKYSLSGSTISITGTPSQAGVFKLAVSVQDSNGTQTSATDTLTINSTASADLAASVNYTTVVPTAATDLNLYFLFGTEKVTVPVTVANVGSSTVSGTATVSLYLSTTPNLAGSPALLGSQNVSLNLAPNSQKVVNFNATIPSTLTAGKSYYLVAKVSSSTIQDPNPANNVGATARPFEFVGTPHANPAFFSGQTLGTGYKNFYQFLRDTLTGNWVIPNATTASNATSFIQHFEGPSLSVYTTSSDPNPTVGYGINLNALSPTSSVATALANDVRAYYKAHYLAYYNAHPSQFATNASIISLLKSLANTHAPVITTANQQSLFQMVLAQKQQNAMTALQNAGGSWSSLSAREQVAMDDLFYNYGNFPQMTQALANGDYLVAAFQLCDAARTTQAGNPGLNTRTEAEFQNLLYAHLASVGQ